MLTVVGGQDLRNLDNHFDFLCRRFPTSKKWHDEL